MQLQELVKNALIDAGMIDYVLDLAMAEDLRQGEMVAFQTVNALNNDPSMSFGLDMATANNLQKLDIRFPLPGTDVVPMRIPQAISNREIYRHIPLVELHEKMSLGDTGLFYAYEMLGKDSGCLWISKIPANKSLNIFYDRVLRLPKGLYDEMGMPDNMQALIQAHTAAALALKFNPSAYERAKERASQCSLWFARHQSAIDRDTVLDPHISYSRFSRL